MKRTWLVGSLTATALALGASTAQAQVYVVQQQAPQGYVVQQQAPQGYYYYGQPPAPPPPPIPPDQDPLMVRGPGFRAGFGTSTGFMLAIARPTPTTMGYTELGFTAGIEGRLGYQFNRIAGIYYEPALYFNFALTGGIGLSVWNTAVVQLNFGRHFWVAGGIAHTMNGELVGASSPFEFANFGAMLRLGADILPGYTTIGNRIARSIGVEVRNAFRRNDAWLFIQLTAGYEFY